MINIQFKFSLKNISIKFKLTWFKSIIIFQLNIKYVLLFRDYSFKYNTNTYFLFKKLRCSSKYNVIFEKKNFYTLGFNVETLCWKNLNFSVWDIGGQDKIRSLWRHYFYNVQGNILYKNVNVQQRRALF